MHPHCLGRPAMPIKHREGEPTVFDERYFNSNLKQLKHICSDIARIGGIIATYRASSFTNDVSILKPGPMVVEILMLFM